MDKRKKNGGHSTRAKNQDGRKNNGGHKTAGKKPLPAGKKKYRVQISLTADEFAADWKSIVCNQFEKKFKERLKSVCNLN